MADKDILIQKIMKHIVDKNDYDRMIERDCSKIDIDMSYIEFILYNKKCLDSLSYDDIKWVLEVCKRINKIGMMDLQSCAVWKASYIFYDINKNIVIVHER